MLKILNDYLNSIKDMSLKDKEHTHRSALEKLLVELKNYLGNKKIKIKHEPNNDKEGRGAPDFSVSRDSLNSLPIGYIENKRVNENLEEVIESGQIKKYLELSDNIIITDYLRFIRIDKNGNIIGEVRLLEFGELKNYKKLKLDDKAKKLLEIFKIFFSHNPKPINTALEFAKALATRTGMLKDNLLKMEDNERVKILYDTFKTTIYSKIEFSDFCDNFAQTLTYSLFLARLNANDNKIDLYNLTKFIPKSFPLIRAMSNFLKDLQEDDDLKIVLEWLLNEIVEIIQNINIVSIMEELNNYNLNSINKRIGQNLFIKNKNKKETGLIMHKDPYLHFYETFLSQYNNKLRELRGVYYTPQSVVNFIINSIDLILKKDFKMNKGFGEALEKDSNITVLDFATGTGAFLLEAFRKALGYYDKNSSKYNPKELINKFYGFEFMIAPYTIAHLKLSQTLKEEFNYSLSDSERLNIFLTNTLETIDIKDEKTKFPIFMDLIKETELAQATKDKEILIITGNPPYSGASANKGIFEDEIRKEYKDNLEKKPLAIIRNGKVEKEKNPKWLLDDYVKFIRFAQQKLDKQKDGGIFGFISNNSFLDNPTFRGMRHSLLKSFDKIYILDLHGNIRKKEISPDGSKDENVFDIMQGVSINIFVRNSNSNNNIAKVYHYDLFGEREEKYKFLFENNLNNIEWKELKLESPFFLFVPQDENKKAKYDKGISVKDMFIISSVGIVSGRDNFCISKTDSVNSLNELKENIKKFMELDTETARKEFNLGKDSRDWQIKYAKEELQKTKNEEKNYKMIYYRPFDIRWTYYTGKSKGFHCMPRGESMEHFINDKKNIALNVSKQSKVSGSWQSSFITDTIVDFSLMGGGNTGAGHVFPLYIYDTPAVRKILREETEKIGDLFEDINHFENNEKSDCPKGSIENFNPNFRKFINDKYGEGLSAKEILGYIYAILFHKEYRKKYFDFLKIDFPKIPFVESKKEFLKLSELGQKLYNLHLMKDKDLDTNIAESFYLKERENIIKKSAFNEEENKIYANDSLYFNNVSKEVWEYKIGGYQVLDKYLKSHKGEKIDINHFEKVIRILTKSIEIEKEIYKTGIKI